MTGRKAMSPHLEQWVAARVGAAESVEDVSWPRASSRVWRVAAAGRTAYVKVSVGDRHYQREVYAYRHAAPALGYGSAPRLLATEPRLRAMLITPLPGALVTHMSLTPARERTLHRAAGGLLRRWHDLAPRSLDSRRQADEGVRRIVERSAVRLARAGDLVTRAQQDLVHRSQQELQALGPQLPAAFRHGDFRPRNWLWDGLGQQLGLLDFERAGMGVAVADFVWLAAGWWPDNSLLREAMFTGYGRELTEAEERALPALAALAVVDDLQWAAGNGDAADVRVAQRTLLRLQEAVGG
jgi:Ser/Thr protein kinase RdoA (MazF antagonist)